MYRALFLKRYYLFFGSKVSNLLQAIIFCTIHLSVSYSPEPTLFVILTFVLGLAWGYLMQRTDSLLGSVLFHAGTDISVIIQIFSTARAILIVHYMNRLSQSTRTLITVKSSPFSAEGSPTFTIARCRVRTILYAPPREEAEVRLRICRLSHGPSFLSLSIGL